jgi:3-dehydroquinate synthase
MKTLDLDLGPRSYSILIGQGLLGRAELFDACLAGNQIMVVSNETVAPLYLQRLRTALGDRDVQTVILPDGEEFKTLGELEKILDALVAARFARDCTLVALGGGVVGDMAGFAAACYQRGVAHVQVPTTLLAQVDSSVGGKTGVNHPQGKNMIGAFHQPARVIIDTDALDTLPDRELCAGLGEVIKYGLLWDADFFAWLEEHMPDLLGRDRDRLTYVIHRSCQIKAEMVSADETESGIRALLNLGHTFGHAIEAGLGFGNWLHGEAVAAGLCLAADLSARLGRIGDDQVERVQRLVESAKLPIRAPRELSADRMLELMAVDKKIKDGKLRVVLLDAIGKADLDGDFDGSALKQTLEECREGSDR